MADEKPEGNPMGDLMLIILGLTGLAILWFATGGPQRADLRGIFLQPPAPLGGGNAYGPQLGTTTPYQTQTDYQYNSNY